MCKIFVKCVKRIVQGLHLRTHIWCPRHGDRRPADGFGGEEAQTGLEVTAPAPVDFEQALHGLAHALVTEDDGRPGGTGDDRVE